MSYIKIVSVCFLAVLYEILLWGESEFQPYPKKGTLAHVPLRENFREA